MSPTPVPVSAAGAVVDRRLAPAGITRLLGGHGSGRAQLLALAAALFACATAALLLVDAPSAFLSTLFVVPVALVAAEFGARVGVLGAAICVVTLIASPVGNWLAQDAATIVARSCALLFVALVIGRISDRGAKSRRLLEQVLEATTDSIYLKDLDGRYLLVNSATARLIGRPGTAIIGRTNEELLPEVAGEIAGHDADVITRDTPDAYEISGSFGERPYILSVTKSPFRDATGATIGALGIARDITEPRRRTMRRSGAHRAGRVDGDPGAHVTTRWRHRDGAWRWIEWTLRTILDERTIYASGRDVTQQRADERALAGSERRYRALVHGLPGTAVLLVDRGLTLEFASGKALTGRRGRARRAHRRAGRQRPSCRSPSASA